MAESQPQPAREFRISRHDPGVVSWLSAFGLVALAMVTIFDYPREGVVLWLSGFTPLLLMAALFSIGRQNGSCTLYSTHLTIRRGKSAFVMPILGLKVTVDEKRGAITFQSSEGRTIRSYGLEAPDSHRLLQALAEAGAEVTGWKPSAQIQSIEDFEIESELTNSLNWRWQDCRIPELALDVTIGNCGSQTVRVTKGQLSLLRKGREVASFPMKDLTLIRQYKKAEPGSARLVLRVGKRDLWPLSDWNSPVEAQLHAALVGNGVPFEEQAWVRKEEVFASW